MARQECGGLRDCIACVSPSYLPERWFCGSSPWSPRGVCGVAAAVPKFLSLPFLVEIYCHPLRSLSSYYLCVIIWNIYARGPTPTDRAGVLGTGCYEDLCIHFPPSFVSLQDCTRVLCLRSPALPGGCILCSFTRCVLNMCSMVRRSVFLLLCSSSSIKRGRWVWAMWGRGIYSKTDVPQS